MQSIPVKPTSSSDRIPSLDFLRGVAILGILFINIENFAYPDSWSPWKYGFEGPIDYSTRFWVYFLTQGKFYTMFALLFGVGFYMFMERLEKKGTGLNAMDIYARRLLWLFIIGVIHAYFVWDGDVLYHYAICGFLLISFRSVQNRYLILALGILITIQLANSYEQALKSETRERDYAEALTVPEDQRTEKQQKLIKFMERNKTKHDPITEKAEPKKPTYWEGLVQSWKQIKVRKGMVFYQGLLFPSLMVMIIGILFYKSGIFRDYRVWKYYWVISIGLLLVSLYINYLRFYHWTFEYHLPTPTWMGMLFTFPKELLGVAYVLILNGVYQVFLKGIRLKLITNIGRMALTNYIFQNILLGLIFYGYGLALFNQFSRFELLYLVIIIWAVQLLLSWLWMKRYSQGPLEWIWRKLTYGSS